jgi:hypothetical protein
LTLTTKPLKTLKNLVIWSKSPKILIKILKIKSQKRETASITQKRNQELKNFQIVVNSEDFCTISWTTWCATTKPVT